MTLADLSVHILTFPFIAILLCSILITVKTKFVQLRMVPAMIRLFLSSLRSKQSDKETKSILPHKALFTAMSTTIGIGNIVGPAIAIRLGGPGAMVGFLIALFFGAATTFSEVTLALFYRKKKADGSFAGGPMEYLNDELGHAWALLYSFFGSILLVVWSSNQSNTLADVLAPYKIPHAFTGILITTIVIGYLIAGIKSIGNLASKIVPLMFVLYCSSCLWIIVANSEKLIPTIAMMFSSFFSFKSLGGAAAGYSLQSMLRWGLAKGTQASESGIGTATIPHSEALIERPFEQGLLSMVSIFSVAIVCTLTGLVTMVSGTWNNPSIPTGISMISEAFAMHLPGSTYILAACAFLFALGTILGNAYNGSRCYLYLTGQRWINYYLSAVGVIVFLGTIFDVVLIWTITDFFIIPVALINLTGLVYLIFKRPELLK